MIVALMASVKQKGWKFMTGTLGYASASGTTSSKNNVPLTTRTVNWGYPIKIVTLSGYTHVLRVDIGGRQDGIVKFWGILADGTTKISLGQIQNQWTTTTQASTDQNTEFYGLYVEYWLTDTISRSHEWSFNSKTTEWWAK